MEIQEIMCNKMSDLHIPVEGFSVGTKIQIDLFDEERLIELASIGLSNPLESYTVEVSSDNTVPVNCDLLEEGKPYSVELEHNNKKWFVNLVPQ